VEAAPTHVDGVRRHFISQLRNQDLLALADALNAVVDSAETPEAARP
jgi:hypothetical protein